MGEENPTRIEQAKVDVPLGANVLVGITYVEPDGSDSHVQVHGRIVEIASTGILIECAGTRIGETLELPPDLYPRQQRQIVPEPFEKLAKGGPTFGSARA